MALSKIARIPIWQDSPIALKVGKFIHDFGIDAEENPEKVKFKETLGLCCVLKGLEKTSKTDKEIVEKGLVVLDALCASLTDWRGNAVV